MNSRLFLIIAMTLIFGWTRFPAWGQGEEYGLVTATPGAEEPRNYPLGPIGGQFRITLDAGYARVVSLVAGGPGAAAGLKAGDLILGAFGQDFPLAGRTRDGRNLGFHHGPTEELGFAIDRAEAGDGELPLSVLRPGTGLVTIKVNLPVKGAFGEVFPLASPKYDAVYEKSVAHVHDAMMAGNGNRGYFTGWAGLVLLGHPDWNQTTGPRPYRLSINKIRDYVISYFNDSPLSPTETYLYDGTNNPRDISGVSGWYVGQYVMFLSEYYARTKDTDDEATVTRVRDGLQRGLEQSANSIQWWKQPAHPGVGYSPAGRNSAGMVGHGDVTGDYMHMGWALGINACGTHTFAGFSFARRAGMNMTARPRDGHYFGYSDGEFAALRADPGSGLSRSWEKVNGTYQWITGFPVVEPSVLFPDDPLATARGEFFDPTVQQKFEVQWKWLSRRTAGFSNPADRHDGHVCYTVEGWNPGEAVGKTAGAVLGMSMYKADGGTLTADDEDRLARFKNFISRNYIGQQDSHAYCLGAQAQQAFALPFLSDRQRQFALENWRFYYALARNHADGFEYMRARYTNDNYLDENFCASINYALPHGIAHGRYHLVPGFNRERLVARFGNPDVRWPDLEARHVKCTSRTLPMPVTILDGNGAAVSGDQCTVQWEKISGTGDVTFEPGRILFSQDGAYRVKMTAVRGSYVLEEPMDVIVTTLPAPPGYVAGSALYEVFTGIGGTAVTDLTRHWKFPDFPDVKHAVETAEGDYAGDSYGSRLSGVIIAPVTGTYRFWIASDDSSELRINPDGLNGSMGSVVASVTGATGRRNFLAQPSQRSAEIALTEGQAIGFAALQKEGGGGDHLSVGWSVNGSAVSVIGGQHLARPTAPVPSMAILSEPVSVRGTLGGEVTLSFTTEGPVPAMYQWHRNGEPFGPMATEPKLTLTNLSAGSEGDFHCTYTTLYGTLTTRTVRVSVTDVGTVATGGLWREMYTGIDGTTVASLTGAAKFPLVSDSAAVLTSMATDSSGNSYGQRWTGWITPPETASYRFYLASDDESELWLSTDGTPGNRVRVLSFTGWTGEKQWSARSPSAWIPMVAGQKYYIEVLHKEGGGGDHCAVAWQKQGQANPVNGTGEISGAVLSYRRGGIYADTLLENAAPVFTGGGLVLPDAFSGMAYRASDLQGYVMDVNSSDLPLLSFSKVAGPAWLQIGSDGILTGTPGENDAGVAAVTVRVTDPGGLWAESAFTITVRPLNHPPVFAGDPVVAGRATAHARYGGSSLASLAGDSDSWDRLHFARVSGPGWLQVAPDGRLGGMPAYSDSGINRFTVRATDSAGVSAETTLEIEVVPAEFVLTLDGVPAPAGVAGGFVRGQTVRLGADIIRGYAVISHVDFHVDGEWIGSDSTYPYTIDWVNVPEWTHAVTAMVVATGEANGRSQESAVAQVYVEYPPQIAAGGFGAASYEPAGKVLGQAIAAAAPGRTIAGDSWVIVSGNENGAFALTESGILSLAKPSSLPDPGVVQLKVQVADSEGVTGYGYLTVLCNPPASPSVREQRWTNRSVYADQTWDSVAPVYTGTLSTLTTQTEINEEARRITALLQPKVSGSYQFWTASDDSSRLYLSTDADPLNKVKIAEVGSWTGFQSWGGGSQQSAKIDLVGGKLYYIEVQHFANGGNDHLSIGWKTPGSDVITAVPSDAFFPSYPVSAPAWIGLQPPLGSPLAGVPLELAASVLHGLENVAAVEFLSGGAVVSTDSERPFAWRWKNPVAGDYQFTARALSAGGTVLAASGAVQVKIGVNSDPYVDADGDGVLSVIETLVGSDPQSVDSVPSTVYQGLVGWWRMDEGSGTHLANVLGSEPAGTLHGEPGWRGGYAGGGLALDGISNHLGFGAGASLSGSTDFTASVWVRVPAGSSGGTLLQQRGGILDGQYFSQINSSGTVTFWLYRSGFQFQVTSGQSVADGAWHQVTLVRQGGSGSIYLDGVLSGSGGNPADAGAALAAGNPFVVGRDHRNSNAYLAGAIDELRLYDRALTAAEVMDLHRAAAALPTAPAFSAEVLTLASAAATLPYRGSLASLASDPNVMLGDVLSYEKTSGPAWLAVMPDGTLNGTPALADVGLNQWTVRVSDAAGQSGEAVILVTVDPENYWKEPVSGAWGSDSRWLSGQVPAGAGRYAVFSRINLSSDVTVDLDSSRTIGALVFGDTVPTHQWTLSSGNSSALTLDNLDAAPVIGVENGTATVAVKVKGSAGLVKAGAGRLVLTRDNDYRGGTVVNEGTLVVNASRSGFNSSVLWGEVTVNAGATLQLDNNPTGWGGGTTAINLNGGSLTGNGGLGAAGIVYNLTGGSIASTGRLDAGVAGTQSSAIRSFASSTRSAVNAGGGIMIRPDLGLTNLTIATEAGATPDGVDLAVSSGIAQSGSACGITKAGAGTLELSGQSVYTGPTQVSAGTLLVNGSLAAGSAVTVAGTGTLGGTGTVNGSVLVNGTIAPGQFGVGTLTVKGTLTLAGTAAMQIVKNGATGSADRIAGASSIVAGGILRVTAAGDDLVEGDTFTLFSAEPAGAFASVVLPELPSYLQWQQSGNYRTITITGDPNRAVQTIAPFAAVPSQVFSPGRTMALTAPVSSSGLPVKMSVKSGPASLAGNQLTLTGAGTVVLAANQAGNVDYLAAAEVTTSFTVARGPQVITFGGLPAVAATEGTVLLNAVSSSGLPVSYTSSNPAVATVNGNVVTVLSPGISTITALQGGNADYAAADSVARTLVVLASITMANDDTATAAAARPALIDVLANDFSSSGVLVVQSVSAPANGVAEVSGGMVRYKSAGGFTGTDSFSYTAADSSGTTVAATVTVSVINPYRGLVAFWRMDEGSGTVTADASGSGRSANLIGSPVWTEGRRASGLEFGSSSNLAAAGAATPAKLTLSAWIKPSGVSGARNILSQTSAFSFGMNGSGLRFTTPGIADQDSSGIALTQGVWQHVAATFEPGTTAGLRFYVNGTLRHTMNASGMSTNSNEWRVGLNQWGQRFGGVLDEVAVYNRILGADEIAMLAASEGYRDAAVTLVAEPWATGDSHALFNVSGAAGQAVKLVATAESVAVPVEWNDGSGWNGYADGAFVKMNADGRLQVRVATVGVSSAALKAVSGDGAEVTATVGGTKQPNVLTSFPPIGEQVFQPGATLTVVPPTASSGLPVGIRVQSGPAALNGLVLTLTGPGTVVLAADQPGSDVYAAAVTVTTSFAVVEPSVVLTGLSLDSGVLSPSFSPGGLSYAASVGNEVGSVRLTAESPGNAVIGIRVNGGEYTEVASGELSHALLLSVGTNEVEIRVTGQDGAVPKTYLVTIARAAGLPVVSSPTAEDESGNSATLGGTVTGDGGAAVTARGVLFSLRSVNPDPVIGGAGVTQVAAGEGTGTFTVPVTGLAAGQIYSFRAYAVNDSGSALSEVSAFSTPLGPNTAPSFVKGADQIVLEDSGERIVPGWATGIKAGTKAWEALQSLSFTVTNSNPALFSVAPALTPDGTLSFTPAADAFGTATVSVILRDDGGTAGGGKDASAEQTFTVTVTAVNDAPSFVKGADLTVREDAGAQSIAGWATELSSGPANEAAQTRTFAVTNDNGALFSTQPAISATGALAFRLAANAAGSATVSVVLRDSGGITNGGVNASAVQTFTITVSPVNDVPLYAMGTSRTVLEDAGAQTVLGWATLISAGTANESAQLLRFELTATNASLFSEVPAMAADGTLTFTTAPGANGVSEVTVVLIDDGGTDDGGIDRTVPRKFVIKVTPVNDPPSFAKGADLTVREDAGAQTIAGWATGMSSGPANEAAQTRSFAVTNDNPALFSRQPVLTASGDLAFTPAANAFGTATVSVVLLDSGGTAYGGVNASAPQSFTITVTPVNDAPSFAKGADQAVVGDSGPQAVAGWATRISAGAANEAVQSLIFEVTANTNTGLFASGPSVDAAGTLSYAPAAGAFGTAVVSLRLRDDGGTDDGGTDVSAVQNFAVTVGRPNGIESMVGIGEAAADVSGGRFLRVNPLAAVNANGLLAWSGTMATGPGGVTAANAQGLWAEASADAPVLLARMGSAAPGSEGTLSAHVYGALLSPPTFNEAGTVAFVHRLAEVGGLGAAGSASLFAGRPGQGNLLRLARGGEVFGTTGMVHLGFTGAPVLSETGDVVVRASFAAGAAGVTTENDSALVLFGADGSRAVVAREGSAAPGSVRAFEDFAGSLASGTSVFRNRHGLTVFNQRLRGSTLDGIWIHDGTELRKILIQGESAPGTGGALFGKPGYPSLTESGGDAADDRGLVIFHALLTGTGVTTANNQAIYQMTAQGNPQLFLRTGITQSAGTHGPVGVAAGDRFARFGTPVTAADGNFGFVGTLAVNGSTVTLSDDTGIWGTAGADGPDDFRLLVREGAAVPDRDGAARSGVTFTSFGIPVFGNGGRAAFTATLSNGKNGLYTVDRSGVVREALTTEGVIVISDVDRGTRAVTPLVISVAPWPGPLQQRAFGGSVLVATVSFSDSTGAAVTFDVP